MATVSVAAPSDLPTQAQNPHAKSISETQLLDGLSVRLAARNGTLTDPTSGFAPNFLQANLLVLPSKYASDFRLLCARNPVPCPLIAESAFTGSYDSVKSYIPGVDGKALLGDYDIRRDIPKFNVYRDSKVVKEGCPDITKEWTNDHVAFLIGCSFSFETALTNAGLVPRHVATRRTISMYRTNIPMNAAGVFTGSTYIVSMRPYRTSDIPEIRRVTRAYSLTHGEPIAWGWEAVRRLGIHNIDVPDWGESPLTIDGKPLGDAEGDEDEIPVFWGCGVTPQEAVMKAELEGNVMAHTPAHMLVLDAQDHHITSMPQ